MNLVSDIFIKRALSHASVSILYPAVRHQELNQLVNRLNLKPQLQVCDFQAAGGYLTHGIYQAEAKTQITMVEPSRSLAEQIRLPGAVVCSPLTNVPRPNGFFDRIGCLAGLHHETEPLLPIYEIYRLLNHGGKTVVAEVEDGSTPARWLNEFVNQYTTDGHKGSFLALGDMSRVFKSAGFQEVKEEKISVPWYFTDNQHMLKFVRDIFGMYTISDDVLMAGLNSYFALVKTNGLIEMPWSLIYCQGVKS